VAIYREPPVWIFDEATSAPDSEAERTVKSNMERLLEGRTAFVIAHRLTTTPDANRICVLEQGQIVEQGTPRRTPTTTRPIRIPPSPAARPVATLARGRTQCRSAALGAVLRGRVTAAGNAFGLVSIDLEIFDRLGLIRWFDLLA
jgi:energy-coupling factor transporter ATP-binding protein EcfA2